MSDPNLEAQSGFDRRALVTKLAVGAFAVPAIVAFKLDSLARAGTHGGHSYGNQTYGNQTWPNQTEGNQTHGRDCDDDKSRHDDKPRHDYPNQSNGNMTVFPAKSDHRSRRRSRGH